MKLSSTIRLIIGAAFLIASLHVNAQDFNTMGIKTNGTLRAFVKHVKHDIYRIQSQYGTIMTMHSGTASNNPKVHVGDRDLAFSSANYKLYVDEGVLAESLKIDNPQDWADFVFYDDYKLQGLDAVEDYIKINKHLPDVPSEQDIKTQGYYDQHEINKVLLQKIEELTLYVIEQQKQIETLDEKLKTN